MNEFKKLNERFDRVENKLDAQTTQLTHVIRDAQLTNYLTPLEATNGIYDVFVETNSSFYFSQLKNMHQDNIINIVGLEAVIGNMEILEPYLTYILTL